MSTSAVNNAPQAYNTNAYTSGLTTNGQNTVDTGRYLIECTESSVRVFDKETQTWVRAWGDPHVHTSDGDKAQFHEDNLTLDLPDGTKVTIKASEPNAQGIAVIDGVAVMKGSEAVVLEGFNDGKGGLEIGNILNNAGAVDAMWEDGTVLVAGHQVDDLTFAADGTELVGTDPNARWNEHLLDGKGGVSRNRPDVRNDSAQDPGGIEDPGGAEGPQGTVLARSSSGISPGRFALGTSAATFVLSAAAGAASC